MLQTGIGTREELVKLQYDGFARDAYSKKQLCNFWFMMCNSSKKIAIRAIQALLLLPSSRLCESTFSVLVEIKSKLSKNTRT